jgi:predicted RNA-binding Zn-ribbon protein involved in translation (DUF1610 family)
MKTDLKNREHKAAINPGVSEGPQPIENVEVRIVVRGIVCPACGRNSVPRTVRSRPDRLEIVVRCNLCGKELSVRIDPDTKKPSFITPIDNRT